MLNETICSIIIPVYNGEKYIAQTIESCATQTLIANIEIIIIDDCSTDSSFHIIESISKNHPNITILKNEENSGMMASLSRGASLAQGKYLLFMGHDDLLPETHVDCMLSEFNENISLVHCNAYIIGPNGDIQRLASKDSSRRKKNALVRFYLTFANPIRSTGALISKTHFEQIDGWNPKYRNYGERYLWIQLAEIGKVKYTNKTRAFYRKHETNISNTFLDPEKQQLLTQYMEDCKQEALTRLFRPTGRCFMRIYLRARKAIKSTHRSISLKTTMKLYYQGKGKNFGDAVNYDIFTEIFGQDVQRTRHYTADCYAIGSILGKILYNTKAPIYARENIKRRLYSILLKQRPINILGSGFIEDVQQTLGELRLFRSVNIIALRGHKTKKLMEHILQTSLDDIALGDPGILVSEFIKGEIIEKKHKLGIIPHVVDQNSALLNDFSEQPDTCILDIRSEPVEFMRKVASCEAIASSTLHGLIAADSLNIPNMWIKFSDDIFGNDFKYHDYYSVYGIQSQAHDLRSTSSSRITPEYVTDNYRINAKEIDAVKSNLTSAFTRFFNS